MMTVCCINNFGFISKLILDYLRVGFVPWHGDWKQVHQIGIKHYVEYLGDKLCIELEAGRQRTIENQEIFRLSDRHRQNP